MFPDLTHNGPICKGLNYAFPDASRSSRGPEYPYVYITSVPPNHVNIRDKAFKGTLGKRTCPFKIMESLEIKSYLVPLRT